MTIGIDLSPLKSGNYLQHRVRGTGFYLQNLQSSLQKYYPDNKYIFFDNRESLSEKVDLVHYPYFEPFFLSLPLFSTNKRIVTVHDMIPLVFPQQFRIGFKGRFKWEIQKTSLKNANAIITDSISSKKDIVKFTGIEDAKIKVIYLAASGQFRKIKSSQEEIKNFKKKYNLPEKFVLYVGDVTWNKNLPRLIEAVGKINASLVMIGNAIIDKDVDLNNSWNSDLLMVRKRIEKNKKIMCLGFVPNEDLVMLYNSASVFAMPSLYEGFGLPILEAMSCGCPVVTSDKGSIPEIAGEAALSVDAYDSGSIANGISEVIKNSELQAALAEKGIRQAKKFSWEKTVKETMRAYKEVIGG